MRERLGFWLGVVIAMVIFSPSARAQNPLFQGLLTSACAGAPIGALAARCLEGAPPGSIAAPSEVSLNPDQALGIQTGPAAQRLQELRAQPEEIDKNRFAGLALFANVKYTRFDREATFLERGFDGDTAGAQVGLDYRFSNKFVAGALFGYDRTETDFKSSGGSSDKNSFYFTGFATYDVLDGLFVEGSFTYGRDDYNNTRLATFISSPGRIVRPVVARSDPDGHSWEAVLGGGYELPIGPFSVGPYARATYVASSVDGYTERGSSGLELRIGKNRTESLKSTLGVRGSYAWSQSWGVLVPQLRFEWEHEFIGDAQGVLTSFALDPLGNAITVPGDRPDRNWFNVGFGLSAILPGGWVPFVDVEALLGHRFLERQVVTAGLRFEF